MLYTRNSHRASKTRVHGIEKTLKHRQKKYFNLISRRKCRSAQLLVLQYIHLAKFRNFLRRKSKRARRRIVRYYAKMTSSFRKWKKLKKSMPMEVETSKKVRRYKKRLRQYKKKYKFYMRKLRKNRRIVKRTKKKLWKTMSEIKYIVRYIQNQVRNVLSVQTSYAMGYMLFTDFVFNKFINLCMRDGRKHVVIRQVIKALKFLKRTYKVNPIAIVRHVILSHEQFFDYRIVRVGRHKTIIVPSFVEGNLRMLKPLRMILDTVRNSMLDSELLLEVEEKNTEKEKKITDKKDKSLDVKREKKKKKLPFFMHLAYTMLYYIKNPHIFQEKSLEFTRIAHENKRNIVNTMAIRIRKRGEKYSKHSLLWNWSKSRSYSGIETHYYKRALKPVPLHLSKRLLK